MPYPYTDFNQVYSWPYGEIAYDLDISPDGKLLSYSHTAVNGDQALYLSPLESLEAGDGKPTASFDFGTAVPEGFVFSPDGRSLYGSSYYTGVSNIYRYDLATQKIEALSNAQTGLFRPLPLPDGRMGGLFSNQSVQLNSSIVARNRNTSPGGFADLFVSQGDVDSAGLNNLIQSYNVVPATGVITFTSNPQLAPLAFHAVCSRSPRCRFPCP